MKILFSPKCLEYKSEYHPESPERASRTHDFLKNKFDFVEAEKAREKYVLLAHTKNLLDQVKNNRIYEYDTMNISIEYPLLSLGAAIKASEIALKGEKSFSLMRPPGHHAGRDFLGGFCYFNNIAIASLKTKKRVAVIDFDCHHGNGSQDIFLGNQNILYISIHQSPLFPGTGLASEKNCFNFPLSHGTSDVEYLKVFAKAMEEIKKFKPELIGVSAGFDAFKKDPLTNMNLEVKTYGKIGKIISDFGINVFSVLEGGYSKELPECVLSYLTGLE